MAEQLGLLNDFVMLFCGNLSSFVLELTLSLLIVFELWPYQNYSQTFLRGPFCLGFRKANPVLASQRNWGLLGWEKRTLFF